jgi:hypothetical protein
MKAAQILQNRRQRYQKQSNSPISNTRSNLINLPRRAGFTSYLYESFGSIVFLSDKAETMLGNLHVAFYVRIKCEMSHSEFCPRKSVLHQMTMSICVSSLTTKLAGEPAASSSRRASRREYKWSLEDSYPCIHRPMPTNSGRQ